MKPRIYFQVFWKKYNLMHFERRNAFQHALKNPEKIIYLPQQKFSDLLTKTNLFFIWPYQDIFGTCGSVYVC